jgi:hypothetical protein
LQLPPPLPLLLLLLLLLPPLFIEHIFTQYIFRPNWPSSGV